MDALLLKNPSFEIQYKNRFMNTIHFFFRWINEGSAYQKFPETVKVFDEIFFIKKDFDIQKFKKVLGLLSQLVDKKILQLR